MEEEAREARRNRPKMAEKTSEYSTFQWQRPFLTVDIIEWYLHMPVEPMEFCKTQEPEGSHVDPEEIPRGCSKPLNRMVNNKDHAKSWVEKRGNKRFVTSVSTSDGIVPSENSYENALEKEIKRLTEMGVLSPARAENEQQEQAFSNTLKVCQIMHLDADVSVKTSIACKRNETMPIKRSSDEMAEMPMLKKLKAKTPELKLKAKEPELK